MSNFVNHSWKNNPKAQQQNLLNLQYPQDFSKKRNQNGNQQIENRQPILNQNLKLNPETFNGQKPGQVVRNPQPIYNSIPFTQVNTTHNYYSQPGLYPLQNNTPNMIIRGTLNPQKNQQFIQKKSFQSQARPQSQQVNLIRLKSPEKNFQNFVNSYGTVNNVQNPYNYQSTRFINSVSNSAKIQSNRVIENIPQINPYNQNIHTYQNPKTFYPKFSHQNRALPSFQNPQMNFNEQLPVLIPNKVINQHGANIISEQEYLALKNQNPNITLIFSKNNSVKNPQEINQNVQEEAINNNESKQEVEDEEKQINEEELIEIQNEFQSILEQIEDEQELLIIKQLEEMDPENQLLYMKHIISEAKEIEEETENLHEEEEEEEAKNQNEEKQDIMTDIQDDEFHQSKELNKAYNQGSSPQPVKLQNDDYVNRTVLENSEMFTKLIEQELQKQREIYEKELNEEKKQLSFEKEALKKEKESIKIEKEAIKREWEILQIEKEKLTQEIIKKTQEIQNREQERLQILIEEEKHRQNMIRENKLYEILQFEKKRQDQIVDEKLRNEIRSEQLRIAVMKEKQRLESLDPLIKKIQNRVSSDSSKRDSRGGVKRITLESQNRRTESSVRTTNQKQVKQSVESRRTTNQKQVKQSVESRRTTNQKQVKESVEARITIDQKQPLEQPVGIRQTEEKKPTKIHQPKGNDVVKVSRKANLTREQRQKLIQDLEIKLENVSKVISKTDKSNPLHARYMEVAKHLAQDLARQKMKLNEETKDESKMKVSSLTNKTSTHKLIE